jgi:proline iminopeptidase
VGDGHRVHWSAHGNPAGLPVVVLHGGPGSGSSARHLSFFPLDRCRVVLMDQRGCGQSTPQGGLEANTTAHLVRDVVALRRHLGVAAWLVVGGSWGATLAMAVAQADPAGCLGVLLRAPFLGGADDLDWFCAGAGRLRPQAHAHFLALPGLAGAGPAPAAAAVIEAYAQALAQGDVAALQRWLHWEATLEQVQSPPDVAASWPPPERQAELLARGRIQTHYLRHACFLAPGALLAGLASLGQRQAAIVQGTLDWVCPPANAWAVHQAWPHSRLYWVSGATHSPFEAAMAEAMKQLVFHFVAHGCFPDGDRCSVLAQSGAASC